MEAHEIVTLTGPMEVVRNDIEKLSKFLRTLPSYEGKSTQCDGNLTDQKKELWPQVIAVDTIWFGGGTSVIAPSLVALLSPLIKAQGEYVTTEHLRNIYENGWSSKSGLSAQMSRLRRRLKEIDERLTIPEGRQCGYKLLVLKG